MTSLNGNNFPVTGPLCEGFTGHRWIPLTKGSDTELWCVLWPAPEKSKQSRRRWFESPLRSLLRHCNVEMSSARQNSCCSGLDVLYTRACIIYCELRQIKSCRNIYRLKIILRDTGPFHKLISTNTCDNECIDNQLRALCGMYPFCL